MKRVFPTSMAIEGRCWLSMASVALLLAAPLLPAAEPLSPESIRERLARVRTSRSADGLTTVSAPSEMSGSDALTLCRFAGDVRARLASLLDTPLDGEDYATGIIVREIADGEEPYVTCSVVESGQPRLRIVIGGLGNIRPESVTAALCGGFLRANAMAAGWGWRDGEFALVDGGTAPYPPWMRLGLARLLDQAVRQDDAERAIARLEAGDLPPVAELLASDPSAAANDPALAAQLAAWLLDGSPRGMRFRAVRGGILENGAWNVDSALSIAAGTADPAAADAAWRRWLADRRWAILTPGSSHPAFVKRLRGLLELRPTAAATTNDVPREIAAQPEILAHIPASAFEAAGGVITPAAVFLHADEPWAPHAAMAMSGRILRAAAGHGDDVLAVARAYGEFFDAVKAREPRQELARRLTLADDLLGVVEGGEPAR